MGGFVGFCSAAAWLYPGGHWVNETAGRHHFWFNYLCDLLRETAVNGEANPLGARLGTVGMLLMVLGLGFHWLVMKALMASRPRAGRLVVVAGAAACLATVAVALTPSDRYPTLHPVAIALAVAPGGLATAVGMTSVLLEPAFRGAWRWFGAATALAVLFSSLLFVHDHFFEGQHLRALPASQRVATLLAVLWIVTTTWRQLHWLSRSANQVHASALQR